MILMLWVPQASIASFQMVSQPSMSTKNGTLFWTGVSSSTLSWVSSRVLVLLVLLSVWLHPLSVLYAATLSAHAFSLLSSLLWLSGDTTHGDHIALITPASLPSVTASRTFSSPSVSSTFWVVSLTDLLNKVKPHEICGSKETMLANKQQLYVLFI